MEEQNLYQYNKENAKKVEILAPAGSYNICKAVIQAGADAVYLGGDFFGARAYAGNFHENELIDAIEYAHQFDRKIYLTVNTLLKECEINSRLISYIKPYYEAGLDAVIVQDFGVFNLIRKYFPDLPIHASTQMTQTGPEGAEMLFKAGALRVVTSRELNCKEIKDIHDRCDVEIESFVHGALCYSYSGQCLLSSFNGTRSGNRGRCAQPCRLAYDVAGEKLKDGKYILSPKDMCALPVLPDVIEAGVYSLKIEGRMKNVTYAAGVTAIYRKYVDMYLEKGRKGYKVSRQDIMALMDLYNRGAFTEGYYTCGKGASMLSLGRPNHMGTKALRIMENVNGRIKCKALESINAHDVFEIDKEHSFSSGSALKEGETFVVNLPKKYRLNPGMELYRTKNAALTDWVRKCFESEHLKVQADISYTGITGRPMSLTIYNDSLSVTVEGAVVEKAARQPASKTKITEQLTKLGDTVLKPGHVEVILSEDAFIPASQLNELRREAAGKMVAALRGRKRRKAVGGLYNTKSINDKQICEIQKKPEPQISVLLERLEHFKTVLEFPRVSRIYFDYNLLYDAPSELLNAVKELHNMDKEAVLALPHILKAENGQIFESLLKIALEYNFDGYLVRNLEELGMAGRINKNARIYTDAGLYITNSHSKEQLKQFAEQAQTILCKMTLPYELTASELEPVTDYNTELIVYGKIPMMLSQQCVRKTVGKCDHNNGRIVIENQNNQYDVQSNCRFCYTLTRGAKPLDIRMAKEIYTKLCPGAIRLEISDEDEEKIRKLLQIEAFYEGTLNEDNRSTLGHFYRGVE
ncbi:MAG: U32 family peptidase [Eubacteriales bacterium]|nr:U32 family peptidase [Eubacteriales bacterium]